MVDLTTTVFEDMDCKRLEKPNWISGGLEIIT